MEAQMQMGLIQDSGDREDGTHFTVNAHMGFINGRRFDELQLFAA